MKIIPRYALTLALFALITSGITSLFYIVTVTTINQQSIHQQEMLLNQIIPSELYDNSPLKECYIVNEPKFNSGKPYKLFLARKEKKPIAMAIEATAPDGYAGAIHLLVGVTMNGEVLGVRVTEHHETPGLGDKIERRLSNWIDSFKGKSLNNNQQQWAVRKDGGMFDQFSGATITPRAVVNAVKQTLIFVNQLDLSTLPRCEENE